MKKKIAVAGAGLAVLGAAGGGIATASGGGGAGGSRMDDGTQLLPQATISERQAIAAAQTRASGALNEVDLERRGGRLVFDVDVGSHDVRIDAGSGDVVAADADD